MTKFDPTELKVILTSVFGSMFLNTEILVRFFIPLLSAFAWYLIKPRLDKYKQKLRDKKKLK